MFHDIGDPADDFAEVSISGSPPAADGGGGPPAGAPFLGNSAAPAAAPAATPAVLAGSAVGAGRIDDVMAVVEGKVAGGLDWSAPLDSALAAAVSSTERMGRVPERWERSVPQLTAPQPTAP